MEFDPQAIYLYLQEQGAVAARRKVALKRRIRLAGFEPIEQGTTAQLAQQWVLIRGTLPRPVRLRIEIP